MQNYKKIGTTTKHNYNKAGEFSLSRSSVETSHWDVSELCIMNYELCIMNCIAYIISTLLFTNSARPSPFSCPLASSAMSISCFIRLFSLAAS